MNTQNTRRWYKMKRTWAGVFVGLVIIGAATGGNDDSKKTAADPKPTVTVTATPSATPPKTAPVKTHDQPKKATSKAPTPTAAAVPTGNLPDFTGMDLQDAQNLAQTKGFYNLDDQDATGAGRFQILDHDWKVCSQEPASGRHGLEITVTMYAVKKFETCP